LYSVLSTLRAPLYKAPRVLTRQAPLIPPPCSKDHCRTRRSIGIVVELFSEPQRWLQVDPLPIHKDPWPVYAGPRLQLWWGPALDVES
jgi:hypothetical protein